MGSSQPFVIQIAQIRLEIRDVNDEDSQCFEGLKRVFCHHIVSSDKPVTHRVVICPFRLFAAPHDQVRKRESTYLGVARPRNHRRFPFLRKREIPQYSGTGTVVCYRDISIGIDYYVPRDAEWCLKHSSSEHLTYVYSDNCGEMSDGLPSMLISLIGSQYKCYLLYASCVAVEGKAFLFLGNSGVGKSTLCLDLVREGASYMGDDLVLVYMDGDQAMVGSLLFPVKTYADRMHTHKKMVDVLLQSGRLSPLYSPLRSVYLLRRTGSAREESYCKPMHQATLFEEMLRLTNKVNTNADGHHFVDTISSVCNSVACAYMFYGARDKIKLTFFADDEQK